MTPCLNDCLLIDSSVESYRAYKTFIRDYTVDVLLVTEMGKTVVWGVDRLN